MLIHGLLLLLYFLPTVFAMYRRLDTFPILLLNIFLGWTIIGWIVALVLSLKTTNECAAQKCGNAGALMSPCGCNHTTTNTPTPRNGGLRLAIIILSTICGTLFCAFVSLCTYIAIADSKFDSKIGAYAIQSRAFAELYECPNSMDMEFRDAFCKCLYEYSVTVQDEYFEQKARLMNSQHENPLQMDNEVEYLRSEYQSKGLDVCENAI